MVIRELLLKSSVSLFKFSLRFFDLHSRPLQMSPLMLYLYLKPLYSILGGSTILAAPFTKKPSLVLLR
jgi:hypothetical protein